MGLCLILTVVFELEVDTRVLRFNSRLVAIQRAVDTNLSTESLLCQTSIWRQVRGSNITSQFHFFFFKLTCVSVSDNTIVQLSQACTISTAYLAVEV